MRGVRSSPVRRGVAALLVLAAAVAVAWSDGGAGDLPRAAPEAAPGMLPPHAAPDGVAAVGFTVSDLDRSTAFYRDVLGFAPDGEPVEAHGDAFERRTGVFAARARIARLRLGDERIELTEYLAPAGSPFPSDARPDDLSFQHIAIVTSDMARAYAHLRAHRVRHASPGPQRLPDWNAAAGGIEAFYFRDPDGHFLEILRFPEGKGDPRWRRPTDRLFLGIDHTAVVVADTDRTVEFLGAVAGLRVVGASENHGIEQERLNGVFGARLRITTLRASSGIGFELLEYLAPARRRPPPADARACDLVHWETTVVVADAEAAARRARSAGGTWMSPGAVATSGPPFGPGRSALVRDPDGHALRLTESVR